MFLSVRHAIAIGAGISVLRLTQLAVRGFVREPRFLRVSSRGMGQPRVPLVNAIAVAAVNLVLDPLLMFKCGLGVAGAAMATAAAQWVSPRQSSRAFDAVLLL